MWKMRFISRLKTFRHTVHVNDCCSEPPPPPPPPLAPPDADEAVAVAPSAPVELPPASPSSSHGSHGAPPEVGTTSASPASPTSPGENGSGSAPPSLPLCADPSDPLSCGGDDEGAGWVRSVSPVTLRGMNWASPPSAASPPPKPTPISPYG